MQRLSRRAFTATLCSPFIHVSPAFGQSCAAPAGGTPAPFSVPAGQTNIQRKPVSALDQNEIARLRLAYQKLRELAQSAPNDPRGWMQQANVHCFQCGGNPGHDIHQSWLFFPWHRAYLYYHEKILGKLINDNSFRLPYWDWDVVSSRNVPPIHRPQTVNNAPNQLFDANRDVNGGDSMPSFLFPANNNPMNAPNFQSFGGGPTAGGALENGVHGLIHVWTGDRQVSASNPDMGRLDTAARDPLFFAHHCNIDRLWAEWLRRNPTAHTNPTSSAWLNTSFTFFDENSKFRRIRVSDVLDSAGNLGFNYPPGAALSSDKPPKKIPLPFDKITKAIKLPQALRAQLSAAADSDVKKNRSLVLDGAVLPTTTGLYFVFAGAPPAAGTDPNSVPNYLGYVGLIKGQHPHGRESSILLRPTPKFFELAASPKGATLTLAPGTSAGPKSAGSRLDFAGVYVTEE